MGQLCGLVTESPWAPAGASGLLSACRSTIVSGLDANSIFPLALEFENLSSCV